MLIQRRPSASMISTFGVSGAGGAAATSPRVRVQRRSLGFGTLGMGTSGLVASHGNRDRSLPSTPGGNLPRYIAGRIQRGGGTGPMKPRQPPRKGKGANSCEMWPRNTRSLRHTSGGFPMAIESLRCKECGTEYPLDARYVCEQCFGPLEVAYNYSDLDVAEVRRKIQAGPRSIWRYSDFLPFVSAPRGSLTTGTTPLVRADRLAQHLGLGELYIKNDAANPTHSFKDRVVSVALAKAIELGFDVVACASTGNLANAVAAHAAHAGLDSYVFIPADLEEQKILA